MLLVVCPVICRAMMPSGTSTVKGTVSQYQMRDSVPIWISASAAVKLARGVKLYPGVSTRWAHWPAQTTFVPVAWLSSAT